MSWTGPEEDHVSNKQTYWIADPNTGAKALVEGAEERNRWTQVQGWAEADEPVSGDLVWVHNAHTDGRTTLPFDAIGEGSYWKGVGFTPGAPSEPVDLTKDPALRDQPKPARPAAESTKSEKPASAADKNTKE
jgi:hypothetical protein